MSNYAKIKKYDIANGEGIRTSIYFCGCPIHCKGCFNQELWDANYGQPYTEDTYQEIANSMNKYIAGLSILGGEPLSIYNIETVNNLCKRFREDFPDKTIWLWTGFEKENFTASQLNVIDKIDVVVYGPFKEGLKDLSLKWRGSSNQEILRVRNPF